MSGAAPFRELEKAEARVSQVKARALGSEPQCTAVPTLLHPTQMASPTWKTAQPLTPKSGLHWLI